MSESTVPDILLPNGQIVPGATASTFLWAGRDQGLRWLEAIPDVLEHWCQEHGITLDAEMPGHSMNLVLFGTSEVHGPVVIKTSPPHPEVDAEIEALRSHNDPRIVPLIDADPSLSIMLLRRIMPGSTLRSQVERGAVDEHEAASIAGELLPRYWTSPGDRQAFIPLHRWYRALFAYAEKYPDGGGRLPNRHVQLGLAAARELLATPEPPVTLHGDLHHDNVLLDAEQGWTIIDPKGLIGERGHDIGSWMLNPVGVDKRPDLATLTNDRLDWFSESLEIDRYRLWQWAMAHSILSDCWNLESGDDTYLHATAIAEVLSSLPEACRQTGVS